MNAPRKDRGRSYLLTEAQIAWAHSRHMDGWSVRRVARVLLAQGVFSASERSLAMSLSNAWKRRGWAVRSQSTATVAANIERAFRPRCSHVFKAGSKQGQRCERRSVGEGGTCWHHDPERIASGVARLRLVDAA